MNKLYPIGIQSFESLRKGGYCYVDKTQLVYQLVKTGKYYFLSRPRRFGKSLLLSTLEAYFKGQKELFAGLKIAGLEQAWQEYPVLHLDLNARRYEDLSSLTAILNQHLESWEAIYGQEKSDRAPEERFAYLIEKINRTTARNVVILIDEYDKPLLQSIGNESLQTDYRNTLKAFYGVLKSCDKYIQFALLTGVTKFSKVSIFSDLNNLNDISMDDRYATICGITEQELYSFFAEDIRSLGAMNNLDEIATRQQLKEFYDGYHFTPSSADLYNPFSVLNTFDRKRFGSYWFETGTPTFLVELLQQKHYNLYQLAHEEVTEDMLAGIDAMEDSPIPVLYQSGYLTLKDFDSRFGLYTLGFPNREVEEGFDRYLLPRYASIQNGSSAFQIRNFVQEVWRGDIDSFMLRLQSFFADTPYELARDLELHYQNVLFIVFKLLGFYVQVEYHTSRGRIDLVLQTEKYIYVMEFKLEGSAEEALAQIDEKQYALPFASDPRILYKVGVNFNNQLRGIEKWLVR